MMLLMGFELRICGVESYCSINWPTTTAQEQEVTLPS